MTENKQAQELIITVVDGNSNPIQGSEIRISEGSFDSFIISDENGEATTPIPSTLNGVDVKCQHPIYEGKLIRLLLNGQDTTSTIQLSDDPEAQLDISITHDKERSATEDQPVSAEELVDEFERVGNQLEKRPTRSEFEKHSQFEADDVYDHFDSWYGIVQAAEINSATRQDLLHELYRLKKELGVPPLAAQIKEDGRFSAYDYQMEFGSMEEALEKIGIDIKSTLSHEIVRIIHDSNDEPTLADFSELTPYSQGAIYKSFNSWEEAIETAKGQQASAIPSFNDGDVGEDDTTEESAGETEPEIQFVTDPEAVPAGVHDDLREAAQLLDETDPTSGSIPDVRTALERAEGHLSKYPDFAGVDGNAIEEAIEDIRSQQESISAISAASTRAERKLVLARGGPSVPSDMPELAEELREAIEESKSLNRPHDKLTEQIEEVEKLVDEADLSSSSKKSRADSSGSKTPRQAGNRWEGPAVDSSQEDKRSCGEVETPDTSGLGVSRANLVEELERIQEKVDGEPSPPQVRKYSKYAPQQYEFEFGGVRDAISAITDSSEEEQPSGNDETDSTENESDSSSSSKEQEAEEESGDVTREEILTAIENWTEDNDGYPRMSTFVPLVEFNQSDIYAHFDSWDDAVDTADIGVGFREKLLDDLKRLEDDLGYPPIYTDIDEHGQYSTYDYQQEFDSSYAALEEAGIDFESYVTSILEDVVAESDGSPNLSDFEQAGPYSQSPIYRLFDTWGEALESVSSPTEAESEPAPPSDEKTDSIRNELSERYELVRNLNDLCQAVLTAKDTYDGAGDDPMDEWATAVQEFYTSGPEGANSYGTQQQDRHAVSMREYRNEFGDGNRVTEFEAVPASEPTASVQALLDSYLEQAAETYHLPVDPESGDRFPVLVESRRALDVAQEMLLRLPETPDSYTGPEDEEGHSPSGEESETSDDLTEVSGISETIADSLHEAGYDSFDDLEEASMDDLSEVSGVTEQIAMRIKLNLDMDSILPESE